MQPVERYHPDRYRISRPFSRQVATIYRNNTRLENLPSRECFEAVIDFIAKTYNNEIENLPFEKRPLDPRRLMPECSLAMHYAAFHIQGRQIFHFNEQIAEQFRKTDVDEIRVENLVFPYSVFYMSFGKQPDLELDDGAYVDGAYIMVLGGENLQVMLTTLRDDYNSKRFTWIFQPEKYYYLSLSLTDPTKSIASVANKALQEDLAEREKTTLDQPTRMEFQGVTIINRRPESLKVELKEVSEGYFVFREALRLIINGLCYLSTYPEDIETRYPDDTPAELLKKIQHPVKSKDIQRTVSKLTSMGYTKIHYCGKAFDRFKQSNIPTGKEVKPHWRRGHWRNQPCGSGRSDRKMRWIMPTIIHKDKNDIPEDSGHIYLVE